MKKTKKEVVPALGLRRAANQIKTQNNTLGTSASGTSLGFHAGKVNNTIYSGRGDHDDTNSQVEEQKLSTSYNAGYDTNQATWSVEVIDQAHSQPI